jgi:hypothetical protein
MFRNKWLVTVAICLGAGLGVLAQDRVSAKAQEALRIDIPTKLEKANVVIDFGHAVYAGDMPLALGDINLLASDMREWDAQGQIVVIFHGDAA